MQTPSSEALINTVRAHIPPSNLSDEEWLEQLPDAYLLRDTAEQEKRNWTIRSIRCIIMFLEAKFEYHLHEITTCPSLQVRQAYREASENTINFFRPALPELCGWMLSALKAVSDERFSEKINLGEQEYPAPTT